MLAALEKLSSELLVALVTAILTAAVALLSVYLTNLNSRRIEEEQFSRESKASNKNLMREKLEELYILFAKWEADIGSIYLTFIPVVSGTLPEKEAWEITGKNQLSEQGSYQRISMLVHMYFPELLNSLEPVHKARDIASRFLGGTRPKGAGSKEFVQAQQNFENAAKKFLEEVAKLSNAL